MLMDKNLLDIVCCPVTRLPLEILDATRLDTLNAAISNGNLTNASDEPVAEPVAEALISRDGRLVYSTGPGGGESTRDAACRRCNAEPCRCESAVLPPSRRTVRVRRERAGRKGKTVTVAGPLLLGRADAAVLLKRLKQRRGTGGTLKARSDPAGGGEFDLELQGDHVDGVVSELIALGYRAKRAGG